MSSRSLQRVAWVGLMTLADLAAGAGPAKAVPKAPTQVYQGELDGQQVWVELTRTARGLTGSLGPSLHSTSAVTSLELPPPTESDGPPAVVSQGLDATSCVLRVAGTHPSGLKAACLRSMQGAPFLPDGFPEMILEDDSSSPGKQFWLRAITRESADNFAAFEGRLRQAEPKARNACARSVRLDQVLNTNQGRFLGYWTWDFCGTALLAAARAGKAEPGKAPWRETAWLGMVDQQERLVAHLAIGRRTLANDQLNLTDLGRVDRFNLVSVEQRYDDAYPTGVSTSWQTRLFASPDHGPISLALGPLDSHETSGNCSGSDLETRWFWLTPGTPANEIIVRTTKTTRVRGSDTCEARDRVTYGGYRFNPKSAKYTSFSRKDFAELVNAQLGH
ncbi:MAG TPA: hypothetical protein VER96_37435 [Polyangiaceae bacterium]|nr:hypothetical protein [Polyangiaceae bacterium]